MHHRSVWGTADHRARERLRLGTDPEASNPAQQPIDRIVLTSIHAKPYRVSTDGSTLRESKYMRANRSAGSIRLNDSTPQASEMPMYSPVGVGGIFTCWGHDSNSSSDNGKMPNPQEQHIIAQRVCRVPDSAHHSATPQHYTTQHHTTQHNTTQHNTTQDIHRILDSRVLCRFDGRTPRSRRRTRSRGTRRDR